MQQTDGVEVFRADKKITQQKGTKKMETNNNYTKQRKPNTKQSLKWRAEVTETVKSRKDPHPTKTKRGEKRKKENYTETKQTKSNRIR